MLALHGGPDERVDGGVVGDRGIDIGTETLCDRRELGDDLPLVRLPLVERQDGRRVVGDVADGELQQQQVVVSTLELRGRRQDHVGVAGGLVQVQVDAHHEVEFVERPGQLFAVGRRQHRVAGQCHQRPDLSGPGCPDLLGEHAHRVLAHHFGMPTPPGCARGRPRNRAPIPACRVWSPRRPPASGTSIHRVGRDCR